MAICPNTSLDGYQQRDGETEENGIDHLAVVLYMLPESRAFPVIQDCCLQLGRYALHNSRGSTCILCGNDVPGVLCFHDLCGHM